MPQELTVHAMHEGDMRVRARCEGHEVLTDYPLPHGPAAVGPTSLQLLLASLATCAANGLAALLRREDVKTEGLEVLAKAQRRETHPTVLEGIHLHFEVKGEGLTAERVEALLARAEAHLCPVWVMLSSGTPISRSLTLR